MQVLLEALNSLLGLFLAVSLIFFIRLLKGSIFYGSLLKLLFASGLLVAREGFFILSKVLEMPLIYDIATTGTLVAFIYGVYSLKSAFVKMIKETEDASILKALNLEELEKDE
jgi:hypothetical protein